MNLIWSSINIVSQDSLSIYAELHTKKEIFLSETLAWEKPSGHFASFLTFVYAFISVEPVFHPKVSRKSLTGG